MNPAFKKIIFFNMQNTFETVKKSYVDLQFFARHILSLCGLESKTKLKITLLKANYVKSNSSFDKDSFPRNLIFLAHKLDVS